MLRNTFNILESLTKNGIIVFRPFLAHIIFTNNISNPGFLVTIQVPLFLSIILILFD